MKKNSFMEGAFIATASIFLIKILGILYIIPFYHLVGVKGAILYGYAYSIYIIFLGLSTRGITVAISKMVSEYNALEQYYLKERAYKIAAFLIIILGLFFFVVLMAFAPQIAALILGELQEGNTIAEVTYVVRLIAVALLIVPLLAVTKGYLQGHQFIYPASFAHLIEQFVRVLVIVVGSYLVINIFALPVEIAVGVAVLGASAGALVAFIYLYQKIHKNRQSLNKDEPITQSESQVSNRELFWKIIFYAMPFLLIDVFKSGFALIDTFTVVRTMVALGSGEIAELTLGVITNLGSKLNMVIISISIGITISLVPNIAASFALKKYQEINQKINQTLLVILFIGLPMTVGMYFLIQPTWVFFYEYDAMAIAIFRPYLLQALIFAFFSVLLRTLQLMNHTKLVLGILFTIFMIKAFLNIPLMHLFDSLGIAVYYAPIFLTLIVQLSVIFILLIYLNKKYQFSIFHNYRQYMKIIIITIMMTLILLTIETIIPINAVTRGAAFFELMFFGTIGTIIYFLIAYHSGLMQEIFGHKFIKKIVDKMRLELVFSRK